MADEKHLASDLSASRNNPESPKVFISYSRVDTAFVDRTDSYLRVSGFQSWIDRAELRGGQVWQSQIEEAIHQCRWFVVVLSPEGARSYYVMKECDLALQFNKTIVPLLYRDIDKPPSVLQWFHSIDFRHDYFQGLEQLLQTLRAPQTEEASTVNASLCENDGSDDYLEEVEIARRLLIFLEDRRVLYTWRTLGNQDIEVPQYAVTSVEKIRSRLTAELEHLKSRTSVLWRCLTGLRSACAILMMESQTLVHPNWPIIPGVTGTLTDEQILFLMTLGELRGAFAVFLRELSAYYKLDIAYGNLKSLLPSGDLPEIPIVTVMDEREIASRACDVVQHNEILQAPSHTLKANLKTPAYGVAEVKALQQHFVTFLAALPRQSPTSISVTAMYTACSTFVANVSEFQLDRSVGLPIAEGEFTEDQGLKHSMYVDDDGIITGEATWVANPDWLGADRDVLYLVSLGALRTHLRIHVTEIARRFGLSIERPGSEYTTPDAIQ